MKRFLTSTAAALVISTGAFADDHNSALLDYTYDAEVNLFASELIGKRVYASEQDVDDTAPVEADAEDEWDDIGEINEIVLSRTGEVDAVIVGVGGFLGIGEKDVALDMSQIKIMREEGDDQDDFFLVVTAERSMLEAANEFERTETPAMTPATTSMESSDTMSSDTMESDSMETTDARKDWTSFTKPDVEPDGYAAADMKDLTAENLTGARVYDIHDEDIGEVSEVILNADGTIKEIVLDIGGYFGIGETDVPVSYDELNIQRAESGDDLRVYIDATQEGLEQRVD